MSGIGDAWEPFGKPYDSHVVDEHGTCKEALAAVNEALTRERARVAELEAELGKLRGAKVAYVVTERPCGKKKKAAKRDE